MVRDGMTIKWPFKRYLFFVQSAQDTDKNVV